jgi:predicted nucleotide-binding protein
MSNDVASILNVNNVNCVKKEIPHGERFEFECGAILNAYNSGKYSWQGKDTSIRKYVDSLLCTKNPAPTVPNSLATKSKISSNKVFVVYGHDIDAREQLELILRRFSLEPIILQNIPSQGATIIEKLEQNIDVKYACVLLTPDDVGHKKDCPTEIRDRARQNVVLELGIFLAKLGREKVAILHKGDIELPSDISGLLYIPFRERVEEQKTMIAAELQRSGFEISIENLLS